MAPSKPARKPAANVVAAKKPTVAKAPAATPARGAASRVIDLRTSAGVAALNKVSKTAGAKSKPTAKSTAKATGAKPTVKQGTTPHVIDLRTAAGVASLNKASNAPAKKSVAPKNTASTKSEVKAKRSRVPADLAAQYGEKAAASTRVVVKEEAPLRKPRRTAAARAKLQQALKPDEGILARLERAKTAGMTKKRVPSRRSKNWNARCGRCGSQVNLATPAGLCPKCGAILMRGEE